MPARRHLHRALPLLLVLGLLLSASLAVAAIRPLDDDELKAQASIIVVATATHVSCSIRYHGFLGLKGSDHLQTVIFTVTAVEAGTGIVVGDKLTLELWDIRKRPADWAGPQGTGLAKADSSYRLYLHGTAGSYSLVRPNGLQPAVK